MFSIYNTVTSPHKLFYLFNISHLKSSFLNVREVMMFEILCPMPSKCRGMPHSYSVNFVCICDAQVYVIFFGLFLVPNSRWLDEIVRALQMASGSSRSLQYNSIGTS